MYQTLLFFMLGMLPFICLVAIILYNKTKITGKQNSKKAKKKIEFKKLLVIAVLATYFLGVAIGFYIVIKFDFSQLGPLLVYIGTPTTGAILSYCYVIRTENAIKLKQLYPAETEGYTVDVNNTTV